MFWGRGARFLVKFCSSISISFFFFYHHIFSILWQAVLRITAAWIPILPFLPIVSPNLIFSLKNYVSRWVLELFGKAFLPGCSSISKLIRSEVISLRLSPVAVHPQSMKLDYFLIYAVPLYNMCLCLSLICPITLIRSHLLSNNHFHSVQTTAFQVPHTNGFPIYYYVESNTRVF